MIKKSPKNIIVCSDGTGNNDVKDRGTNVFKIFESVDLNGHKEDEELLEQIAIYDDGVGTEENKWLKIAGGAFGWGLSRNIRQLYAELSRVYDEGDHIYLFGFSRGAYTVRMLAGFIFTFGLLKLQKDEPTFKKFISQAYSRYYRKYRYSESDINSFKKLIGEDQFTNVPVKFIGVWDTVDAVGLPFDEATEILNKFLRFRFNNNKLHPGVEKACHAIAMDDQRRTFHPVLWDEENEKQKRIEQVWFPGMHSNVGGGYPKQGMSLVSLNWMMEKAEDSGLRFISGERKLYRERRNINDKLYDSRSGLASYYRYKHRNIFKLCEQNHTHPKIHISAIERILQSTNGYAPGNFPKIFDTVFTNNAWYDSTNFKNTLQNELGSENSLLDRHKTLATIREWSYYGFLFSTLFAVVGYKLYLGEIPDITSREGIGKFWNDYLVHRPWIYGGFLISVIVGIFTRFLMKKRFTQFWYSLLKKL